MLIKLRGLVLADRLSVYEDLPLLGFQQPRHDLEQCRFSGTVRGKHRHKLALIGMEIHPRKGLSAFLVAKTYVNNSNHRMSLGHPMHLSIRKEATTAVTGRDRINNTSVFFKGASGSVTNRPV